MRTCIPIVFLCIHSVAAIYAADLLTIDDGVVRVGIDREKGGAITWLSSHEYPSNIVNVADPGRLIQQSYYAGRRLNRVTEGQHKAWSPWSWNPIQGGGVGQGGDSGTWSRVTQFRKTESSLYSETIPKLWDMADEEADAVMRQWSTFEPDMAGVVAVTCELQAMRDKEDRWGGPTKNPQETPACYFTRNFDDVRSYLGEGRWRKEAQPTGPPWGKTMPPRKAMAMFEASGQGVAVFSPTATQSWNFGPHGSGLSDQPDVGPCMHVAPIDRVLMGHQTTYRFRYWLVIGDETDIAKRLDMLWGKYSQEQSQVTHKNSQ
ncbi:hypothetical protein SAMN06265222_1011070 [Neorhodopirellula lusitana]|uniref:Secreted protein n=1 Tax=Neorhodopirellula lusitana TaxID=445327 RepID=A0ABY1PU77_9BACT|nr:hypothetical protein [Neorhodopirellula lusitana]SMP44055.1 hypothetical protein SAMN06265222_1011070 [Neorhodopirellula lusitana]